MTSEIPSRALVNSRPVALEEARLLVTDEGVSRGDGSFETLGVWDGRPFRLDDHLERLDESLRRTLLELPDRETVRADIAQCLEGFDGDAVLRCYITGSRTRIVTLQPQPTRLPARHLVSQLAPWIHPLASYPHAGAKTMSYGPNMTATRAAQRAGGDEALLVSTDGIVLEGPTFCILWVVAGVLHAVPVERGIVASMSRRSLLELAVGAGVPTKEAEVTLETLAEADEVFISSSARGVDVVKRIDDYRFSKPTPMAERLDKALEAARRGTAAI